VKVEIAEEDVIAIVLDKSSPAATAESCCDCDTCPDCTPDCC